jgi:hypothetical protein
MSALNVSSMPRSTSMGTVSVTPTGTATPVILTRAVATQSAESVTDHLRQTVTCACQTPIMTFKASACATRTGPGTTVRSTPAHAMRTVLFVTVQTHATVLSVYQMLR